MKEQSTLDLVKIGKEIGIGLVNVKSECATLLANILFLRQIDHEVCRKEAELNLSMMQELLCAVLRTIDLHTMERKEHGPE